MLYQNRLKSGWLYYHFINWGGPTFKDNFFGCHGNLGYLGFMTAGGYCQIAKKVSLAHFLTTKLLNSVFRKNRFGYQNNLEFSDHGGHWWEIVLVTDESGWQGHVIKSVKFSNFSPLKMWVIFSMGLLKILYEKLFRFFLHYINWVRELLMFSLRTKVTARHPKKG